eukprot:31336-Pelagococcus_subviridis.AAC.1
MFAARPLSSRRPRGSRARSLRAGSRAGRSWRCSASKPRREARVARRGARSTMPARRPSDSANGSIRCTRRQG